MAKGVKKTSKIRRILYALNIRRVFTPIRRFAKPSMEFGPVMRRFFAKLFPPPRKEVIRGKVVEYKPPMARNILLSGILIFILFIAAITLYVVIGRKPAPPAPPVPPVIAPPEISMNITGLGLLDSKNGERVRWYAETGILGNDLDSAKIKMLVFKDFAPRNIFLLRSVRKDVVNYEKFRKKLMEELTKKGMVVTEIIEDDLLRLPETSKIVLIVPSGYLPTYFLGMEDPEFNIRTFTQRGNVLIYIGRSPEEHVILRDGSLTTISAENIKKTLGIVFPAEIKETDNIKSLYSILPARIKEIPVDVQRKEIGFMSVTWGGGGYAYFISTTLDTWWEWKNRKEKTAIDISNIVANAGWQFHYVMGDMELESVNRTISAERIIFTGDYKEAKPTVSYGRILIEAAKKKEETTVKTGRFYQLKFPAPPRGKLYHGDEVIATPLSGERLDVTYTLNEPVLREVEIFLRLINNEGTEVETIPLGRKSLQVKRATHLLDASLKGGKYILRITDARRNLFAQSYLKIPIFKVVSKGRDWGRGEFTFDVSIDGNIPEKLKPIKMSLDGKDEKEVEIENGKITYKTTTLLFPGNHTFQFNFGKDRVVMVVEYIRRPTFLEKYWYMIAITAILFGIGLFVKRPTKIKYAIDVPDFPPLHAIAIPIKKETLIGLFDSINKELKWEFTPLGIQDLKTGFRRITFRGRPVVVGDYNLEHILDQLVEEGYLKKALEYYGLVEWEKKANKSIYLLAMQRKLRDLFVIEGIPFLPFGQRPDCDTVVTVAGEKVFIHVYESDEVIPLTVQTASEGRSIIVFENEGTMREFTSRIHSTSETNTIFKLLLDDPNGNIFITPVNKLIEVLHKEFTFFYY